MAVDALEGTGLGRGLWTLALLGAGLVALASPCLASETEERPALGAFAGARLERGVETKGVTGVVVQARSGRLRTASGVRWSHGEHAGLSGVSLGGTLRVMETWRGSAKLTLQHEQWSDWEIGENRALLGVEVRPGRRVTLELGLGRRWPVLDPARYASAFEWKSPVPAWTPYYALDLVLVDHPRVETWLSFANRDRFSLSGPDFLGVHLFAAPLIGRRLRLVLHWATTVQGIVPIALFAKDLTFELGVLYQP